MVSFNLRLFACSPSPSLCMNQFNWPVFNVADNRTALKTPKAPPLKHCSLRRKSGRLKCAPNQGKLFGVWTSDEDNSIKKLYLNFHTLVSSFAGSSIWTKVAAAESLSKFSSEALPLVITRFVDWWQYLQISFRMHSDEHASASATWRNAQEFELL